MIRAAMASSVPLGGLTSRGYRQLVDECGGEKQALRFLVKTVERSAKPLVVNLATSESTSTTLALAPRNWTEQRLAGFLAGHRELLEAEFGEIARISALRARRV